MSKALKDRVADGTRKSRNMNIFSMYVLWNMISPLSMTSKSLGKCFTPTNALGYELLWKLRMGVMSVSVSYGQSTLAHGV